MTATTIGAGSDKLALAMTEDAYQGDAQLTISVDDQQVGGTLTAASPHGGPLHDSVDVFMGTVSGLITSSPGGPASELRLEHSTVTGASFQQGASDAGDLSIFTRDLGTGAAGTDVIHVAGSFAPDAFVFANDAPTQSALVRLAPLPQPGA